MYGEYVKCSVGGLPSVQLGVQGVLVGLDDEGCMPERDALNRGSSVMRRRCEVSYSLYYNQSRYRVVKLPQNTKIHPFPRPTRYIDQN